jgi:hypothetical protein
MSEHTRNPVHQTLDEMRLEARGRLDHVYDHDPDGPAALVDDSEAPWGVIFDLGVAIGVWLGVETMIGPERWDAREASARLVEGWRAWQSFDLDHFLSQLPRDDLEPPAA